jgi:hypothetical protein
MQIEVDQSGKIENTSVPTVLAFSNGTSYTILIPARVKRQLILYLRKKYHALRIPYMKIFTTCLALLITPHINRITTIIIDTEYPGHDGTIKSILLNHIRRNIHDFSKHHIVFNQIGKHSPAHLKAYNIYTSKSKPSRVITLKELKELL